LVDEGGFGAAVRRRRIAARFTQEQLAGKAGLSARSLGDIERGRVRYPRPETVRLLAAAFELAEAELAEFHALARADYWAGREDDTAEPAPAPAAHPVEPVPSASPVPAQLPADVAAFTGRDDSLRRLDTILRAGAGQPAAVTICAITGPAGVGKTALAVHWAHHARHRFPDGQLYVNLRGYDTGPPLRPIEALARLLHALGVPADQVPTEVTESAALFRSLLADRRMLVVLDNAQHPMQVRPLLPGSPASLVVVTSRDTLTGLVAREGAHRLSLGVLSGAEARVLLARVLGADRVAAEPEAAAELAHLCDHLPLALRISAANLVGRPADSIADLVGQLGRGNRLEELAIHGDDSFGVRAAFDLSYQALPEPVRRTFRLVGLVPGPDLTVPAAAALTGDLPETARRNLDMLAAAHLVDPQSPGRYALHDLLRLYASERAEQEDGASCRDAAVDRLLDWYLETTRAAADLLYPQILRLESSRPSAGPPVGFTDGAGALVWLGAERANLLAGVQHAAARGPAEMSWLLTDLLRGYFWQTRQTVDWLEATRAGQAAATAAGDGRARAAMEISTAMACHCMQRYPEALRHYTVAAELAATAGWPDAEGAALGNLGLVHAEMGDLRQGAACQQRVLEIARASGRNESQVAALNNLGWAYGQLGELRVAADRLAEALNIPLGPGDTTKAHTLDNLGTAERFLGNLGRARECLDRALAAYRAVGNRYGEAEVKHDLALLHLDSGRPRAAAEAAAEALTLAVDNDDRRNQANIHNVLGHLASLDRRPQQALAEHDRALELADETSARFTEADARIGLAVAFRRQRQHGRSLAEAGKALKLARHGGYAVLEGQAVTTLGETLLASGDHRRAAEHARVAVDLAERTGHRLGLAHARRLLGDALAEAGRTGAAADQWRSALAILTDLGVPAAAEVAALLRQPGRAELHSG
jgi:tetratricopeptide (TPR) repeat protein/transcriptional regulator with XRE-family HTH domain